MNSSPRNYRCVCAGWLAIFIIALAGAACTPAAPTVNATDQAAAMQKTENALREGFNQTATAEKQVFVQQLTQAAAATQTAAVTPTFTITPTRTAQPTATPNPLPTLQYQAMLAKVQQYVKDGFLSSADGEYTRLADHEASVAKILYFESQPTGYSPVNFAIESDVAWDNASTISNWFASGCGFIFHHNPDNEEDYLVFLSLDGYAESLAWYKGHNQDMGYAYYGELKIPAGKAHIAMTVKGNQYAFFVNGKMVKKYTGFQGGLMAGELRYAQVSGTNKGFGTRCTYTNTDLWTVKE